MAERLRAHLPLVAVLVVAGLAGTATLTYAAGRDAGSVAGASGASAPKPPLVVPNVAGQAFVFAKGALEDAGFAWRVDGSVHGYAANTVVSQSPAAGSRLVDTGAPLVTLTLKRNGGYAQAGTAQDVSPYAATAVQPVGLASALGPAHPATTTTETAPPPAPKTAPPKPKPKARSLQARPPAFTVPGGRPEPLDEMPLPDRAQALRRYVESHPHRSRASTAHWLYQNEWIVTGAKLGWWHGADALETLVAVDRRAQELWGIGARSARQAAAALATVRSRTK